MADVAVVGAGVSGALCALELARDGHQVLVLDRRQPATGSTLASTALVQFELDEPFSQLSATLPGRQATRAWQRSQRAVHDLARLVHRERIACAWEAKQTLYLAGDRLGERALARELRERQQSGLGGEWVSAASLGQRFGITRRGAILSRHAATCNPVRLTAGLLRAARARGARVYAPANVLGMTSTRGGIWLEVDHDRAVFAQQVVFCTGYEPLVALPARAHSINSTWAIAAQPSARPPRWMRRTLVWEASDPYLYMRLAGDALIVGGRDESHASRYTQRPILERKQRHLERALSELRPSMKFRTTHCWGGAFGTSPTGLPIVDQVPGVPRAWMVAALGGNGMTFSMIAAQVVRHAIRGRADQDARLFRLR